MAKIPSARDRTPGTAQTPRIAPEQQASIAEQRAQAHTTRRTTVAALEDLLFEPVPVLDHGFVRVVDYMGDDEAIVQAARVSYGRGSKRRRRDRGLIRYLMRNWHTTPFEMCEIKLHVKLPIFVARQWIRHRTASVNEYSARYSVLDREFYVPARDRLQAQSTLNSQGSGNRWEQGLLGLGLGGAKSEIMDGGDALDDDEAQRVLDILTTDATQAYEHYEEMLNLDAEGIVRDPSRQGLARELARMNLSLNYYTQWYWKIDLLNLLHFVWLRSDDHAQYEIRAYAEVLLDVIRRWVPLTYDAFMDYRVNAASISGPGLAVLRRMLSGEEVDQESSGLSGAEWRELMKLLKRPR